MEATKRRAMGLPNMTRAIMERGQNVRLVGPTKPTISLRSSPTRGTKAKINKTPLQTPQRSLAMRCAKRARRRGFLRPNSQRSYSCEGGTWGGRKLGRKLSLGSARFRTAELFTVADVLGVSLDGLAAGADPKEIKRILEFVAAVTQARAECHRSACGFVLAASSFSLPKTPA